MRLNLPAIVTRNYYYFSTLPNHLHVYKKRFLFIALLSCFFSAISFGQNSDVNLNQFVPPSPTAEAIAKFGEIPVSPYTGIANISIPLYEVKNKELTVPITLAYHSGGVKVEEEASWVGLGWSLLSGG